MLFTLFDILNSNVLYYTKKIILKINSPFTLCINTIYIAYIIIYVCTINADLCVCKKIGPDFVLD